MSKYITDEDITIYIEQGNTTREIAKLLLKKNQGDIVSCLIELQEKNIKTDKDIKISTQNKLNEENDLMNL